MGKGLWLDLSRIIPHSQGHTRHQSKPHAGTDSGVGDMGECLDVAESNHDWKCLTLAERMTGSANRPPLPATPSWRVNEARLELGASSKELGLCGM